jgi:hypothetical protein
MLDGREILVSLKTKWSRRPYVKSLAVPAALWLIFQPGLEQALAVSTPPAAEQTDFAPSGTMLLPLTPKLDPSSAAHETEQGQSADDSQAASGSSKSTNDSEDLLPSLDTISAEKGPVAGKAEENDSSTDADGKLMKGTVQIVADDTEYDQDANTFLGTGNAVALIGGQNSKLEADSIRYNQTSQIMDARGNVRILRGGQLTTGSAFKFKVTSDEYLITAPDTQVQGSEVVARTSYGAKGGIAYKDGAITSPTPFYYRKYYNVGPMTYREESNGKMSHPDAYLAPNSHLKFKASKIVYERYKEFDNMTIFGGRVQYGAFSLPVGKVHLTVGQTETRAVFPVLPYIGSNFNMGGVSVGPSFNYGIGHDGILTWSPLIQSGGRNLATSTNESGLGLGARAGYSNKILQTNIAYGEQSNMLVADFKSKVWGTTRFQGGINRFLNDGMMGTDRARLQAEFVDLKQYSKVPFMSSVQFRTSCGFAEDNPQLINISSNYAKLFGSAANTTVMRMGLRAQEHFQASTAPFISVGDDRFGLKGFVSGGTALRGYSTGNANIIGQIGPLLDLHMSRLRMMGGFTEAAVRGSSPFVFDQYLQGSQSTYVMGDYKVSKYLDVGGMLGYNLTDSLAYAKTVQVAVGPPDMKVLGSYDFVMQRYRVGFDMLYGQPVPFQKMVLKTNPDQGNFGGI